MLQIRDTAHYDEVVNRMLALEELPDAEQNAELKMLAEAVEAYDDQHTPLPAYPTTLRGILQVEMARRNIRQRALAALLEIHETRLSELLRGKRDLSIDLARKLYHKLHIPAETILTLRG